MHGKHANDKVLFDAEVTTTSLAVSPDAKSIAAGFEDHSIALLAGGAVPRMLQHTGSVVALRFSAVGDLLAAAGERFSRSDGNSTRSSEAGAVGVWRTDAREAAPVLEIEPELGRLLDVAWRDEGTLVILGEEGLSLYNGSSGSAMGNPVTPLSDGTPRYSAARISPNGLLAAAVDPEGSSVAILNTNSGKEMARLKPAHDGNRLALAWTPDSAGLVTAGATGTIELWSARNGTRERVLFVANRFVSDVAVSGDGQWVTAALDNGTIQMLKLHDRVQASTRALRNYLKYARTGVFPTARTRECASSLG